MPDVREEFEAWMIDRFATDMGKHAAGISMDTLEAISREMWLRKVDGEYQAVVPREMWAAWQSSRAALKVELPTLPPHANSIGDYARGFMAARSASKEALQQAGIEVK